MQARIHVAISDESFIMQSNVTVPMKRALNAAIVNLLQRISVPFESSVIP